jgi:hypothetical protein
VCEAIKRRLAREAGKPCPQEAPAWQSLAERDPFVPLIGAGEDDAADVRWKKYDDLFDAYREACQVRWLRPLSRSIPLTLIRKVRS